MKSPKIIFKKYPKWIRTKTSFRIFSESSNWCCSACGYSFFKWKTHLFYIAILFLWSLTPLTSEGGLKSKKVRKQWFETLKRLLNSKKEFYTLHLRYCNSTNSSMLVQVMSEYFVNFLHFCLQFCPARSTETNIRYQTSDCIFDTHLILCI